MVSSFKSTGEASLPGTMVLMAGLCILTYDGDHTFFVDFKQMVRLRAPAWKAGSHEMVAMLLQG